MKVQDLQWCNAVTVPCADKTKAQTWRLYKLVTENAIMNIYNVVYGHCLGNTFIGTVCMSNAFMVGFELQVSSLLWSIVWVWACLVLHSRSKCRYTIKNILYLYWELRVHMQYKYAHGSLQVCGQYRIFWAAQYTWTQPVLPLTPTYMLGAFLSLLSHKEFLAAKLCS